MGLWAKLFRWRREAPSPATRPAQDAETEGASAVAASAQPFVFECQACGKVFEARRKHPRCPECDSRDVSLLAE